MITAVRLPTPALEADVRRRSALLVTVVQELLQGALAGSALLLLQLECSLLVDGPVVATRPGTGAATLTVVRLPVPATAHVPAGHLVVAVTDEAALAEARLLPVLLAALMDTEVRRYFAENALRGALEIASRDPATGLGNRRAWMQALRVEAARAERSGRPLTVLVLDLDGLKAVNDACGHAAGDELIVRTAGVLVSARRMTDQVCRLGGDEFGIVAPDTDRDQAAALAARIRGLVQDNGIRLSLGWAVGSDTGVDVLWQQADAAMYEDKRTRRA